MDRFPQIPVSFRFGRVPSIQTSEGGGYLPISSRNSYISTPLSLTSKLNDGGPKYSTFLLSHTEAASLQPYSIRALRALADQSD